MGQNLHYLHLGRTAGRMEGKMGMRVLVEMKVGRTAGRMEGKMVGRMVVQLG
jgi:hypothetical protein